MPWRLVNPTIANRYHAPPFNKPQTLRPMGLFWASSLCGLVGEHGVLLGLVQAVDGFSCPFFVVEQLGNTDPVWSASCRSALTVCLGQGFWRLGLGV